MTGSRHPSLDPIGELTIAETSLGEVVRELYALLPEAKPLDIGGTTRYVANQVIAEVEKGQGASPEKLVGWLKDVKGVVKQRNAIVHAVAKDRCVMCGNATHFVHKGKMVERSPEAVLALVEKIDNLTVVGMRLGEEWIAQLNRAALEKADVAARETGEPQWPPQSRFIGVTHMCGDCTGTGGTSVTVHVPPIMIVTPPGFDRDAWAEQRPQQS